MRARLQVTSLCVLLLCSVLGFAADIQTDYDHHVDFSTYKTYSWLKVETPNSIWDDRIKDAVNKALTAKGLSQVPSGGDIGIVAVATTREKPTLQTFYDGFGGWYWQGFGNAITTVQTYKEGTLVVDMFDANTKHLIWRGTATDTLSGKPDKNTGKLDKAVEKMFSHFPPKRS